MIISVKDLVKFHKDQKVLDNVSFSIENNSIISIIGKSGSGKTTLAKILNGLVPFDSGNINILGYEVKKENIGFIRSKTSFIFQDFNLFLNMKIKDFLLYRWVKILKRNKQDGIKKLNELLTQLHISPNILEKYPSQLSGGQKQRISIIRSLMDDSKIIIMDEPTASLDPLVIKEFAKIINFIKERGDILLLIITHDINFARYISDKVMLISNGKVTDYMDKDDFFNDEVEKSNDAKEFLNSSLWL